MPQSQLEIGFRPWSPMEGLREDESGCLIRSLVSVANSGGDLRVELPRDMVELRNRQCYELLVDLWRGASPDWIRDRDEKYLCQTVEHAFKRKDPIGKAFRAQYGGWRVERYGGDELWRLRSYICNGCQLLACVPAHVAHIRLGRGNEIVSNSDGMNLGTYEQLFGDLPDYVRFNLVVFEPGMMSG